MNAVVETLHRVPGRQSDIAERIDGLRRAADAARGRVDPALVTEADGTIDRALGRLKLSDQHTVVALAGATGSGKSSLFNALCGLDLAGVGVRRPTTSWALACSWGPEGAEELLDWLGIAKRHQVNRMGMLDESAADRDLEGLVLLDLPDHDSTEVQHHLEVQRLVTLVDLFIWVLDPQKYADAAIHDRFLRPLATHSDVMLVVLNHIDEIPASEAAACLGDVGRLLALDGLGGVPVIGTSATRGEGLDDLNEALASRVSTKKLVRDRISADVAGVAQRLAEATGDGKPWEIRARVRGELQQACIKAAGVPAVVEAVRSATALKGREATAWPVTSRFARRRGDPLRKLDSASEPATAGDTTSDQPPRGEASHGRIPEPERVLQSRLDAAVRAVSDDVTAGMGEPWRNAIRTASTSRVGLLADELNVAVSRAFLGLSGDCWWWRVARALQWILFAVAVVGALWLATLGGAAYMRLSGTDPLDVKGVPLSALLLIVGVVLGVVVALMGRQLAKRSAEPRARRADGRLRTSVGEVSDRLVVQPMQVEIDAYAQCRRGLDAALKR
jgi:GTP-binding protein EngB required for normal cell division